MTVASPPSVAATDEAAGPSSSPPATATNGRSLPASPFATSPTVASPSGSSTPLGRPPRPPSLKSGGGSAGAKSAKSGGGLARTVAAAPSTSSRPRSPHPAATAAAATLASLASSLGLPPPADPDFDGVRATTRFGNAVARGAATGAILRGGLHAVSLLLAAAAPSRAARRRAAGAPGLAASVADTARWAAFLGAYAGTYVAVDEAIAAGWGRRRTAAWRAAAAGAAAAPAIALTGPADRHTSLALYVLVRGVTLLVRIGNKPAAPPRVRAALAPTRWVHGDTALMCLATAQIAYSWIFKPHTLPPSFVRFLNRHGGHDAWYYASAKELGERTAAGLPLSLTGDAAAGVPPMASLALVPPAHVAAVQAAGDHPCDWAHPGTTCNGNAARFFPGAYARALPVYAPVYVLPALLVHRRRLFTPGPDAAALWAKIVRGAARSAAFLALYCTLAWRGACVGFRLTGRITPGGIAASAWTGGLATLVEKKSRRMELALYCVSRALESAALCLPEWGLWPAPRQAAALVATKKRGARFSVFRLDTAIFAAASAAIMHCYSDDRGRHRDVFRSKYLEVLDFILGADGVGDGAIRHVPSTRDLVAAAAAAAGDAPAAAAAVAAAGGALAGRARSLLGSLSSLAEAAAVAAADAARERAAHGGDDSPTGDADGGLTSFGPAVRASFEDGREGGRGRGGGGGGRRDDDGDGGPGGRGDTASPGSSPPSAPPPVTFASPRAWPGGPTRPNGPHPQPPLPLATGGGAWTTGAAAAGGPGGQAPRWRKNGWEARLSGDFSEEELSPRPGGGGALAGLRPSQWAPRPTAATAALRAAADAEAAGRGGGGRGGRGGGGGGGRGQANHPATTGVAARAAAEAEARRRARA